jgi:hypothetical protein
MLQGMLEDMFEDILENVPENMPEIMPMTGLAPRRKSFARAALADI